MSLPSSQTRLHPPAALCPYSCVSRGSYYALPLNHNPLNFVEIAFFFFEIVSPSVTQADLELLNTSDSPASAFRITSYWSKPPSGFKGILEKMVAMLFCLNGLHFSIFTCSPHSGLSGVRKNPLSGWQLCPCSMPCSGGNACPVRTNLEFISRTGLALMKAEPSSRFLSFHLPRCPEIPFPASTPYPSYSFLVVGLEMVLCKATGSA